MSFLFETYSRHNNGYGLPEKGTQFNPLSIQEIQKQIGMKILRENLEKSGLSEEQISSFISKPEDKENKITQSSVSTPKL